MKTDHPIYLFLSAGAEAFRVLTGGYELEVPTLCFPDPQGPGAAPGRETRLVKDSQLGGV